MDSKRVREKFDKLPPKRKQVLLKVLADESKQKIALELCDGSEQAVQQHLRQLYKDFYIQGDRERKRPALIQLFIRCMPELIDNHIPGVIHDLPHDRGTAKLHQESDEIVGISASEPSPEQVVLAQSQPNHSLSDQEQNTPDASHLIEANSFLEYFAKAIDQLESKHIHVRIGAISSLGKLAKYSRPEEHWTIMEYLTAFIRNAPPRKEKGGIPDDIQTALTVIGRRDIGKDPENQKLNLSKIDIAGANLRKANLQRALLYETNLLGASLSEANLQGAVLDEVNLQAAILWKANLQKAGLIAAWLQGADFQGAQLQGAGLIGADMERTSLDGADLKGANLKNARNLELEQIQTAFGDSTTILPGDVERPAHWM